MPMNSARARQVQPLRTRDTSPQSQTARSAPPRAHGANRIESLDLARGIAITLMILSHGVKGLIGFEEFPSWGLVPIHLITKFSSSLFILIFGISLAVAFLPQVNTPTWNDKRRRLLVRGLVVLFWYKVLTIVEMFHLHERQEILAALKYHAFPSYVEILGFYGIALLWIPFALSVWKVLPLTLRLMVPVGFGALTMWLGHRPDLFTSPQLQALLIEHDDFYTWGQISRAPLIFAGLLIGEAIHHQRRQGSWTFNIPRIINYAGLTLLLGFVIVSWQDLGGALHSIALNKGKHPPELPFMLFSLGGSALILGACLSAGKKWARTLSPLTLLGRESLSAFVFHAFVLFIFYRYLFDLWNKVTYGKALMLAILLVGMSMVWVKIRQWVKHA